MPRNATLTVADDSGGTVSATNVACGQVFVCTGQSNMELTLAYVVSILHPLGFRQRTNYQLFLLVLVCIYDVRLSM